MKPLIAYKGPIALDSSIQAISLKKSKNIGEKDVQEAREATAGPAVIYDSKEQTPRDPLEVSMTKSGNENQPVVAF